jgi:Flp pilus assembly protein TadD
MHTLRVAAPAALGVALALAVVWAFAGVVHNGFVDYDDDLYVVENAMVRGGLNAASARWAFTTGHASNWHPVTWLSHLLDVTLFGLDPGHHHRTSLLWHAANTVLVFLVLRALTGATARSAFVAALFGVHPAHVESVAWVAERKDVLSAFFGLLALWAYGAWARRPGPARHALVAGLLAAGLLAKPMLVTLPLVFLLLDAWPLRRWPAGSVLPPLGLVREKALLFALAAASGVVTLLVQGAGGAVKALEDYPLGIRVANAVVAYVRYLGKLLWPRDLAVFYPHPGASLGPGEVAGAALILGAVSVLALRRGGAVRLGWLWFLGTLVPVIGLVQVGWQAMADRYTYLPGLGVFLAVTWTAADVARGPAVRMALGALGLSSLLGCAVLTRAQVARWRDSETLFTHALAVTGPNFLARNNLGHYLNNQDRPAEALVHLEEAVRLRPRYAEAVNNLGRSMFLLGRLDLAAARFEEALALAPDDALSLNNLAFVRLRQGRLAESIELYRRALARSASWAEIEHRLGLVLLMVGQPREAQERLARAAALEPEHNTYAVHAAGLVAEGRGASDSPAAAALRRDVGVLHRDAGLARYQAGDVGGAEVQFRRAVELNPRDAEALNNLGYMLLVQERRGEAARAFREALRLRPDLALARNNLALALGPNGPGARP